MSDDEWQGDERDRRDPRDVDESASSVGRCFRRASGRRAAEAGNGPADDTAQRRLRFGPDDTGPLPHWTAPPTGEIPSLGTPPPTPPPPTTTPTTSTCGRRSRPSPRCGATTTRSPP